MITKQTAMDILDMFQEEFEKTNTIRKDITLNNYIKESRPDLHALLPDLKRYFMTSDNKIRPSTINSLNSHLGRKNNLVTVKNPETNESVSAGIKFGSEVLYFHIKPENK